MNIKSDVLNFKVISHDHKLVSKTYYISKDQETWIRAAARCHEIGMEFLTLESKHEADYFIALCNRGKTPIHNDLFHIGGTTGNIESSTGSDNEWFWMESGVPIRYDLQLIPGDPNSYDSDICLAVGNKNVGTTGFFEVSCSTMRRRFFCQRVKEVN